MIIGATPEGKKELVGLIDGVRESVQSWRELLLDLRRRGLSIGPELAVADGALGFWQAVEEVWPKTRGQRCWVHKTVNVLNKLPKSLQAKAKRALQDIWMAKTKKDALAAFDAFVETYGVKYDKAVACLVKDRDALLAFYDFPAEHWKHLRTTNPMESTFATPRRRDPRVERLENGSFLNSSCSGSLRSRNRRDRCSAPPLARPLPIRARTRPHLAGSAHPVGVWTFIGARCWARRRQHPQGDTAPSLAIEVPELFPRPAFSPVR